MFSSLYLYIFRFSNGLFLNLKLSNSGRGGEEFAEEVSAALDAAYDNEFVLPDLKK